MSSRIPRRESTWPDLIFTYTVSEFMSVLENFDKHLHAACTRTPHAVQPRSEA
jgi:hypothetical protein